MSSGGQSSSAFGPAVHGTVFAVIGTANLYLAVVIGGQQFDGSYGLLAEAVFFCLLIFFRRYSLLWPWKVGRIGSIGTRVFTSWLMLGAGLLLVGFLTRQAGHFGRRVILIWLVTTPFLFAIAHLFIRYLALRFFPQILRSRSALMVFLNPVSQRLSEVFGNKETPQFNLLGFFEDREPGRTGLPANNARVLGGLSELPRYVNTYQIEVVFVVLPVKGVDRAMQVVEQLGDTTASVYYVPDCELFQRDRIRLSEFGGMNVMTLTETPFFGADGLLKRLMDIAFAGLLLLCLAPLFLLTAVAVRLTMGAPVFFAQRRYGLNGQQIRVQKFRTMVVTEDGAEIRQASREDSRVTPLGHLLRRMSIDEWPQLWNVLKGEMSLVGPRPHAITHNEQYRKLVNRYMVRHKVKPGLTGWAQVNGLRGEIHELENMQSRVAYDLDYIQRWSPGLDIFIILRTIWIIFRDHEAY